MAACASNTTTTTIINPSSPSITAMPQWKKDLIARLKQSSKKTEERYWFDQHPPKQPIVADLIIPTNENGFKNDRKNSNDSNSSEEDLHYGPGIVNKLKNKYLSLALREAASRPTILRKATSLENLLEENDGGDEKISGGRLFRSRGGEAGPGSHLNRYARQTNRQEMKRARSVEAISRRLTGDSPLSPTALVPPHVNNRQSLHEEMLLGTVEIEEYHDKKPFKKMATATENGAALESESKYSNRINRPKRIQPLLNEKEKPPLDVVSKAKMIFEKRPETRTKKPPQTGDVAAKVEGFNSIIVKSKVANSNVAACKKPPIKHSKPVLTDKQKNTHSHHRPVAKPVILNPDIEVKMAPTNKPKTLELGGINREKWNKWETNLPSPIPDVSRVDQKNQENNLHSNPNSLCETPDLILTSSPVQMLHSPTFRKNSTEKFLRAEQKTGPGAEATNRFISPLGSPTKNPTNYQFNATYTIEKSPLTETPRSSAKFNSQGRKSPSRGRLTPNRGNDFPLGGRISPSGRKSPSGGQISPGRGRISPGGGKVSPCRSPVRSPTLVSPRETFGSITESLVSPKSPTPDYDEPPSPGVQLISPTSQNNISKTAVSSSVFNFTSTNEVKKQNHLPTVNKNVSDKKVPVSEPLEIEINGFNNKSSQAMLSNNHKNVNENEKNCEGKRKTIDMEKISTSAVKNNKEKQNKVDSLNNKKSYPTLNLETSSDNSVNQQNNGVGVDAISNTKPSVKNSENINNESLNSNGGEGNSVFPKKLKPKLEESTQVFNFTKERRDVPDYISNDMSRVPQKPSLPQPGDGGIILLAGATMTSSFIDEEEEILRSLEGPPSPCDVTFVNDNILIKGRSSLIKETRRSKLKISFVETTDIFEYPSEDSLLIDVSSPLLNSPTQGVGHSVPMLSGSTLANYMPKTMEDFQLGVTKTYNTTNLGSKPDVTDVTDGDEDMLHEEIHHPSIFSNTTNADMLF